MELVVGKPNRLPATLFSYGKPSMFKLPQAKPQIPINEDVEGQEEEALSSGPPTLISFQGIVNYRRQFSRSQSLFGFDSSYSAFEPFVGELRGILEEKGLLDMFIKHVCLCHCYEEGAYRFLLGTRQDHGETNIIQNTTTLIHKVLKFREEVQCNYILKPNFFPTKFISEMESALPIKLIKPKDAHNNQFIIMYLRLTHVNSEALGHLLHRGKHWHFEPSNPEDDKTLKYRANWTHPSTMSKAMTIGRKISSSVLSGPDKVIRSSTHKLSEIIPSSVHPNISLPSYHRSSSTTSTTTRLLPHSKSLRNSSSLDPHEFSAILPKGPFEKPNVNLHYNLAALYFIYVMETTIHKLLKPNDFDNCIPKICFVVNAKGAGIRTLTDPIKKILKSVKSIGCLLYPELMSRTFIINAPWIAVKGFKLVSPFLHPITVKKIGLTEDGFISEEDLLSKPHKIKSNICKFQVEYGVHVGAVNEILGESKEGVNCYLNNKHVLFPSEFH